MYNSFFKIEDSMEHISALLATTKTELGWSYGKISNMTHIHKTTVSKHFNGKRKVSLSDLRQYCKCFGSDFEEIKTKYSLDEIDICKKGTLKTIIASVAGIGVGALVYAGVKNIIDTNCKQISK